MRLDKYISYVLDISREEAKKIIKNKEIMINNKTISDPSYIIDNEHDSIKRLGETLSYNKYIYLMLNKPAGYLSATIDQNKTVLDLIDKYKKYNLAIAGRLDIDSVGLLILTNDGDLIHKLTNPKSNILKKYYVEITGSFNEEDIKTFQDGIVLKSTKGEFTTKPAILEILSEKRAYISISEGKYHQVKLMCEAIGTTVKYLKRLMIGNLKLDENLMEGKYRDLNEQELSLLKNIHQN